MLVSEKETYDNIMTLVIIVILLFFYTTLSWVLVGMMMIKFTFFLLR